MEAESLHGRSDGEMRRHDDVDEEVAAIGGGRNLVGVEAGDGFAEVEIGEGQIESALDLTAELV